jgi:anti-anti-sigma factor
MPVRCFAATGRCAEPMGTPAHLEVRLDVAHGRLALAGELDHASAPAIHDAATVLAKAPTSHVTVDLAELQFIDAAGLGAIVQLQATLAATGRHISLRQPSAQVRRTFAVAGLAELL